MTNEDSIRGWFDCLNAVAIEFQCDLSFEGQSRLIDVMRNAGITLEEVRRAQELGYETLDKCNVLFAYEGMCMSRKRWRRTEYGMDKLQEAETY